MTTGDVNWIIDSTRVAASSDLKDRFQTPLRQAIRDRMEKVYPDDGVFNTKLGISGAVDAFAITGTSESTDGDGELLDHVLATDDGSNVPFENLIATSYYVAFTATERPKGIQTNPRTGAPEYIELIEDIGDKGDPDSVVDNGADLTFNINSLVESGVDFSGRTAVVYMKSPAEGATTEAVAIETATVAYGAPNNTITTTGLLGQSSPASTTPADYEVVLLGPTVRKNTDLRTVSGIVFIGIITGGGAGNSPTAFDTADQNRIFATLSSLNNVLDDFVQNKPISGDPVFLAGPRAPITTERGLAAAALYADGLIYVMGGEASGGGDLDDNEAYDSSSDAWIPKTVIPVQSNGGAAVGPRSSPRAAVVDDVIYLMGGEAGGVYYELVQRYEPGTNTWDTPADDLPAVVSGGAVGVINGKIYYAGGEITAILGTDDTHEYDPDLNTWTTVASISTVSATAAAHQGHAVVDDKLYVFGGTQPAGPNFTSKCFVYDPAFDQWAAIAPLPDPTDKDAASAPGQPVCEAVNGVIHVFGGPLASQGATNYHLLYNNVTDSYVSLGRLRNGPPESAEGVFVANEDGIIYLIGGRYGRGSLTMEDFVSGFDARNIFKAVNHGISSTTGDFVERGSSSDVWATTHPVSGLALDTMSDQIMSAGAVEFEGAIYVSGGWNGASVLDTLEIFHPETNTWTLGAAMTFARRDHGMVKHEDNRRLYVVMGLDSTGAAEEDTIEEYDPDLNAWATTESGIANARHGFLCALVSSSIYWVGGFIAAAEQDDTRAYDLVMGATTNRAILPVTAGDLMGDAIRQREPGGKVDGVGWWIYAFGGVTSGVSTDDLHKYDTVEDQWIFNATGPLLSIRSGGVALPVENPITGERHFVIFGGEEFGVAAELDTELFDPDNGSNVSLGNLTKAGGRKFVTGAHHHGRVYAIGGDDAVTELDDIERISILAWPIRPILENFSNSRHVGPGAGREPIQRDTIAFKTSQIWGYGSWDAEAEGDIIKIGED